MKKKVLKSKTPKTTKKLKKVPHVVIIGGGTGTARIIEALQIIQKKKKIKVSAIVSVFDSGGSTGMLREDFNSLPAGDIRNCIAAAHSNDLVKKLLAFRFSKESSVNGHNLGNLLMFALSETIGSDKKAVEQIQKTLSLFGNSSAQIIPVTYEKADVMAYLETGEVIVGEANIDIPSHDGTKKITRLELFPTVSADSDAIKAINTADHIIFSNGDLYSSLIPNFLVAGITDALKKSKAKKIYIPTQIGKYGETWNYTALDFVKEVCAYSGISKLDMIFFQKFSREVTEFFDDHHPKFSRVNINDVSEYTHSIQYIDKGNYGNKRYTAEEIAYTLKSIL